MRKEVDIKTYTALPDCRRDEILRFAGVRGKANGELQTLLEECLKECDGVFTARVCYLELTVEEFFCYFPPCEKAKTATAGCETVLVFAATVGIEIDRLMYRYANVSPTKSLLMQAIGAERIETLCDAFCEELKEEKGLYPQTRFSPGYGDFSLKEQKQIFALLQPEKRIGVGLTESLTMTPTKSVTAVVGLKNVPYEKGTACEKCKKTNCDYRKG
ncbi:MAG: Vitamin B12 dependent methionine synthase activation subunit [Clostridia bacterium]|nr:Vitamin B12 dependent methionine synthase activation subunit [Clostridia bacterium]